MTDPLVSAIEENFTRTAGEPMNRISVGEQFRSMNSGPAGVNARRALDAFRDSVRDGWTDGGLEVLLALAPETQDRAYQIVMFALNNHPGAGSTTIEFAWRLLGADEGLTPTEAFAEILNRYGLPMRIAGGEPSKLIVRQTVDHSDGLDLGVEVESGKFVPFVLGNNTGGPDSSVTWAFCPNETGYAEDVKRRRG